MYGYVFQNINGRSHGNTLRILLFLLSETYTDTHSQDSCGKDSSGKHWWNLVGEKYQIGNACSFTENKVNLIGQRGWHQNGRKEAEFSSCVEEIEERCWHWGTNIISWSRLLGMHLMAMQTQREKCWTAQQDVRIPCFCWSNREITRMGQTSGKNFCVVLRHGRTCSKMRGTVLRIGKQEDRATMQRFLVFVWTITNSKKEELENKGKLSDVCSHIVLKCLYLARTGRPDILWLGYQFGTICHKMDSSMWQTTGTINFLHSFHEWLPPVLSCGQCGSTLSIGIISRFRLFRGSWRFKINIRGNLTHFRKSHVRIKKLDVHKHLSHTVQRNLRLFLLMQVYAWTVFPLSIFGIWLWKCFIPPKTNSVKPKVYLHRETCFRTPHQTSARETKPKFQPSTTILICVMLTVCLRTWIFLNLVLCCTFSRITKPWLRW